MLTAFAMESKVASLEMLDEVSKICGWIGPATGFTPRPNAASGISSQAS